ncbi:TIR domain-containing protein [Flavisolibacter nicotianae]|uniref:TIR domain-containing protein n=1 Tax=Flavisolibacter nicotianae TaxID=2364882 RepID=UPI000EB04981|nr:nucleotide-binding protein [Flavisolibacter nicotianae]
MKSKQQPLSSDQLDEGLDLLFEQFGNSMTALQLQDIQSSEQALVKARNLYQQVTIGVKKDETIPLKIVVNLIEIPTRLLRSTFFSLEERYAKALEELQLAKAICDEVNASLQQLPQSFYASEPYVGFMDLFRFMFLYYDRVVATTTSIITGTIAKNDGLYVDEVGMYRNAAAELRKVNNLNFKVSDIKSYDVILPMVNLLNHLADIHEKKAEKLEEKRKRIEFLSPIDKKVFLVHGHNEAVLRELKEMLEEAGIEPVILKYEQDDGKTLIEKFEHYGRLCAFAFVIVTPDDWVENKKKKYFQARPNVLFELGWFCGRYGRDKVRIIQQKETPLPSDLNGIVTIEFTEHVEEAYRKIIAVLEKANILQPKAKKQVSV